MEFLPYVVPELATKFFIFNQRQMAWRVQLRLPDEVARIGALSIGSNGQRSIESAPLHFCLSKKDIKIGFPKKHRSSFCLWVWLAASS